MSHYHIIAYSKIIEFGWLFIYHACWLQPKDGRYSYSYHRPRCRSSNAGSINVELERLLAISTSHRKPWPCQSVDLCLSDLGKAERMRRIQLCKLVWPTCRKVVVMILKGYTVVSLYYIYIIFIYIYIHFACWTAGFQNHVILCKNSQLLMPPK